MHIHNALDQISLQLGPLALSGFSISGLATYIQIPELDICFDMGECPLSAVSLNHVFLSHAHGDHARCLMRHNALRRLMGIEREAVYYLPSHIIDTAKEWIEAEARFEGVSKNRFKMPKMVALENGAESVTLSYRKDLAVRAFDVEHTVPAMGFTILKQKKKLNAEHLGKTPTELIALRKSGVVLEILVQEPFVTFIGDCSGQTLMREAHIFESKILIIETTFLLDGEQDHARSRGHTHIDDFVSVLNALGDQIKCDYIVLKHFSMKYTRHTILSQIEEKIPLEFKEKILVLI